MALRYLLLGLLAAPLPLSGQTFARPESIRPKTCAKSDALLAPDTLRPDAKIQTIFGLPPGSAVISFERKLPNAKPISHFTVTALLLKEPNPVASELTFFLGAADLKTRVGQAAELSLVLDDSVTLRLGVMHQGPTLGITLPLEQSQQVAKAHKVSGRLGETAFTIDEKGQEGIRALYVAAVCGLK